MQTALIAAAALVALGIGARALLVLSARRRYPIREIPGFLSDAECDHLVALARPRLRPSAIVADGQGGVIDTQRRSGSALLDGAGDPVVQDVKRRIAETTGTRVEQQERLQVTHYHEGERYGLHYDALGASGQDPGAAGDRALTVILYLNDGYRGGATVFPYPMRRVRPEKGKAVVFRNLTEDGTRHEPLSRHAGAAVHGGEKWLANQWIRQHRRQGPGGTAGVRRHVKRRRR